MRGHNSVKALGIIGGVGPLASAEFLKTIYEQCRDVPEQQMPKVFLSSDPGFPERCATPVNEADEEICRRLQKGLHDLNQLDVSHVVICCLTIHHFLPRLSAEDQKNIISLVDLIFEELVQFPAPHILLCSNRTSHSQLFQRHPRWPEVSQYLIVPNAEEQQRVHNLISYLKRNGSPQGGQELLARFAEKYDATRFICGCTEMHLLAKWFQSVTDPKPHYAFLDPLMIVAQSLADQCASRF